MARMLPPKQNTSNKAFPTKYTGTPKDSAASNTAGVTTVTVTGMPTLTCQGSNTNSTPWSIPFCIPVKSGSSYTITVGTANSCSASLIAIT